MEEITPIEEEEGTVYLMRKVQDTGGCRHGEAEEVAPDTWRCPACGQGWWSPKEEA